MIQGLEETGIVVEPNYRGSRTRQNRRHALRIRRCCG